MSEIDINKMVEKAKRRKQWSVSKSENAPPAVLDGEFWLVACDVQRNNATFIAQAPATILALHQQVQDLQAENATLWAQVGEWQRGDVVPPLIADDVITVLSGTTYTQSGYVEALTPVKAYYEVTTMPNGETETRWVLCLIEREVAVPSVFAWRPIPDDSPTAAVVADLESKDEDCPVCGGTGWIQEGWGEYHMDGIPCLACEEREGG